MKTSMRCSTLPLIHTLTYFALFISLSADQLSYSDHCASFVPEATTDLYTVATLPLNRYVVGHYAGGNPILKDSSSTMFTFQTREVQKTDHKGVVKVEADLMFLLSDDSLSFRSGSDTGGEYIPVKSSFPGQKRVSVDFRLHGFWSESSGRLCMVGSSYATEGEEDLKLKAVLKLNNVNTSASITSLITGTLESLSSPQGKDHQFDPISVLMFPQKNYKYSLASKEIGDAEHTGNNLPVDSMPNGRQVCDLFRYHSFSLQYSADCNPEKNCSPVDGSLHPVMSPYVFGCHDGDRKFRVLLHFSNGSRSWYYGSHFDPKMTLVGEGLWDDKTNELHIDACHISIHLEGSFTAAHIEDCSISLSFSFPTVRSLKERSSIVGEIHSKKSLTDSAYFGNITARTTSSYISRSSDLKYEYTELERVAKFCPAKNGYVNGSSEEKYPNWHSRDLSFYMSVENSKGEKIEEDGNSYPLFVGDQVYQPNGYDSSDSETSTDVPVIKAKSSGNSQINISYTMTFWKWDNAKLSRGSVLFNGSVSNPRDRTISAEGIYDMETGRMCMVGCRNLNNSLDCDILIKLQFPPLDSKKVKDGIRGTIESMRKKSDPLYFESLNVSASAFYTRQSARSIWRLDLELSLVLVSNTFSCIFTGLQLFYLGKHQHVLPLASLLMLTVLTLGHAIPLVLNFEAQFADTRTYSEKFLIERGRLIKVEEVLVRVATLVTFLFEFRLLQRSFSAKRDKKTWVAEKKALLLSLPLYAVGALAAMFMNWNSDNSILRTWKCYAGLVLDGFLLPQIMLNIFSNSREKVKVLSGPFYIGTTLVRALPHAYDLWRARNFVMMPVQFEGSYLYGAPGTDFYSIAWDVVIPLGGIGFVVIIYLQQRFGGTYIVPRRFKINSTAYERVPMMSHA